MANEVCDGFLKLVRDGQPVKGESSDADFKDIIELLSFEFGSSQSFEDDYYAVQKVSDRRQSGMERMRESVGGKGVKAMVQGFENLQKFEGKDLSEEDACQFKITKLLDWSSPDLFQAYCSVQNPERKIVFDSAQVSMRKTTGGKSKTYLEFHFGEVAVASYSIDISGDAAFKETISFSFGRCRMEYKPQDKAGSLGTLIQAGWSFIDRGEW
jgi:type VI protein secretion system component Hcp